MQGKTLSQGPHLHKTVGLLLFKKLKPFIMRVISAYLLAVLGGNDQPTAGDINKILESVGISADAERVSLLIEEMQGKTLSQVIEAGKEKLSKAPAMGGAAPAAAAGAAGAAPAAAGAAAEEAAAKSESEEVCTDCLLDFVCSRNVRLCFEWPLLTSRPSFVLLYSYFRRWAWACLVTTTRRSRCHSGFPLFRSLSVL